MKTLRFTVLILSLANCFASKSFASEPSSDQPARRTLAADGNLDHALCPVTGDPVAPEFSVALEGGKVYFSSGEALREYRGNRNDFDELARAQLVVTGQAEQIRCPVSRKELSRPVVLRIEGVDVGFASAKAQ
ncbi:MAG: hypothetical protein EHM42_06850, partial [Planctomycetaceae bacterium]